MVTNSLNVEHHQDHNGSPLGEIHERSIESPRLVDRPSDSGSRNICRSGRKIALGDILE
jgi:hypothetical protein